MERIDLLLVVRVFFQVILPPIQREHESVQEQKHFYVVLEVIQKPRDHVAVALVEGDGWVGIAVGSHNPHNPVLVWLQQLKGFQILHNWVAHLAVVLRDHLL